MKYTSEIIIELPLKECIRKLDNSDKEQTNGKGMNRMHIFIKITHAILGLYLASHEVHR